MKPMSFCRLVALHRDQNYFWILSWSLKFVKTREWCKSGPWLVMSDFAGSSTEGLGLLWCVFLLRKPLKRCELDETIAVEQQLAMTTWGNSCLVISRWYDFPSAVESLAGGIDLLKLFCWWGGSSKWMDLEKSYQVLLLKEAVVVWNGNITEFLPVTGLFDGMIVSSCYAADSLPHKQCLNAQIGSECFMHNFRLLERMLSDVFRDWTRQICDWDSLLWAITSWRLLFWNMTASNTTVFSEVFFFLKYNNALAVLPTQFAILLADVHTTCLSRISNYARPCRWNLPCLPLALHFIRYVHLLQFFWSFLITLLILLFSLMSWLF